MSFTDVLVKRWRCIFVKMESKTTKTFNPFPKFFLKRKLPKIIGMYINKSLINYLFNVGKISLYVFIKRKFEMSFIKQSNIFKKTENSFKKIFNFYIIILLSNCVCTWEMLYQKNIQHYKEKPRCDCSKQNLSRIYILINYL